MRLRDAVTTLPAYVPGARLPAGLPAVKLSSNENPYPPLPSVVDAIVAGVGATNRYPDLAAVQLVEALAERLTAKAPRAVTPAEIVVGTGSVGVLEHLLDAVCDPGDEVLVPWRSFEAYPIAVAVAGARFVPVPLQEGHDADGRSLAGRLDLAALAAAIGERTRVVVVCTPNNPTGPAVHADELESFLAAVPPHVMVILDEAYVEFVRDPDAPDGLAVYAAHPNVVLLRTFSKAYGLAALRVGYAVARPDLAAGVRAVATPFGVGDLAQRAALASLAAEDELLERVETLVAERTRVTDALREQGWDLPDAQGNFVWFPLGARTAELGARARDEGVLVRPFAGEGVRVSIGSVAEDDAFLRVAAGWR
ncbi:histidinol-phosphate aminotransferase [Luteimicrobium subarcticum]|uniref:Aromatic amino acid aminotransferase n=1 Tax=Luteimicrobium subarcticum TaxID=620910 RepID=A0A2M8WRY0_9MICO|nr:histidinol-phosphate aminotransferase [Luteimicrobium subarcticum]